MTVRMLSSGEGERGRGDFTNKAVECMISVYFFFIAISFHYDNMKIDFICFVNQ